jgi:hypothetical protein
MYIDHGPDDIAVAPEERDVRIDARRKRYISLLQSY